MDIVSTYNFWPPPLPTCPDFLSFLYFLMQILLFLSKHIVLKLYVENHLSQRCLWPKYKKIWKILYDFTFKWFWIWSIREHFNRICVIAHLKYSFEKCFETIWKYLIKNSIFYSSSTFSCWFFGYIIMIE